MSALRRLRAVLLFAMLSAVGWAVVGTLLLIALKLLSGSQLARQAVINSAKVLAAFGFAAGTTWAVALAVFPRKADQSVTASSATAAGALGGVMVVLGMFIAMGFSRTQILLNLLTLAVAAGIGGVVGLAIQRVAARGQLPAPDPSPKALEP